MIVCVITVLLNSLCCREENSQTKLRFTFTPMHGVGQKFVAAAFEAFNLPEFVSVPEQVK